jgi:hypothetical protein
VVVVPSNRVVCEGIERTDKSQFQRPKYAVSRAMRTRPPKPLYHYLLRVRRKRGIAYRCREPGRLQGMPKTIAPASPKATAAVPGLVDESPVQSLTLRRPALRLSRNSRFAAQRTAWCRSTADSQINQTMAGDSFNRLPGEKRVTVDREVTGELLSRIRSLKDKAPGLCQLEC